MSAIPLEDNFTDILGKAQRGLKLEDEELASRAGVSVADLKRIKEGDIDEVAIQKVAPILGLGAQALVDSAKKSWYPKTQTIDGLAQFNTPYQDMTVNVYLAWDPATKEAAVFDTGTDSSPLLNLAKEKHLKIKIILLTHTHPDHIADLPRLLEQTGSKAFVCELERIPAAETFSAGKTFRLGQLEVETRQTSGHSRGGITYVLAGLSRPVAVVGDAIFAGSMGGGAVSYSDALMNNRKKVLTLPEDTILCPGHGPLSTVGEEKSHNPFFPEFNRSKR
jgi:hydroxyacylglutathione hydrolase